MKVDDEIDLSERAAPHFEVAQEREVVPGRAVTVVGLVGCLTIVACMVIAGAVLRARTGSAVSGAANGPAEPSAPREIAGVRQSLLETAAYGPELAARERRALEAYGWVDRDAGIAQIPIERAMDLIVDREPSP